MATVNSLILNPLPEATVPTPPRTSLDEIVGAGRTILDAEGVEALTMQAVAAAVGVRSPSLFSSS